MKPSPASWVMEKLSSTKLVVVVQSLSRVQLFATPWTAACQVPLSFTIPWSLLKLMSTELIISYHISSYTAVLYFQILSSAVSTH